MRLDFLPAINRSVGERGRLLALRDAIEGDKLQVTVSGVYQDDAIVALVTPVVVREISARVLRLEADLRGMGVELEGDRPRYDRAGQTRPPVGSSPA